MSFKGKIGIVSFSPSCIILAMWLHLGVPHKIQVQWSFNPYQTKIYCVLTRNWNYVYLVLLKSLQKMLFTHIRWISKYYFFSYSKRLGFDFKEFYKLVNYKFHLYLYNRKLSCVSCMSITFFKGGLAYPSLQWK
jgi:hypothetical protein